MAGLKNVSEQVSSFRNLEQKADNEAKKLGLSATAQLASFAWVVSGDKTQSGRPMLSGNPQMGFDYPSIVYEAHLTGGSGYDVEGFNVVGMPVIAIGMNDHLAWSFMVGMGDNVDIYQETLNPNNKNQYMYKGKWVDFEKHVETISVAGGGSVQYTVYRSVHGPVIAPVDFDPNVYTGDKVFTWKSAHWMKDAGSIGGFLELMKSSSVKDLIKGSKEVYTSLHMVGADDKGNIGYTQAGLVPVRPANSDFRLPLSGEGDMEWTGEYLPNPVAINPEKGFVTGWNGKSTPSSNNPDSRYFGPYNRGLWLERELKDMKNMTMEDMLKVQKKIGTEMGTSGGLYEAGILITDLLPLLDNALKGVPKEDANYEKLNSAYQLLANWNGHGIDDVVTSTQLKPEQLIFDKWIATLLSSVFDDELKGLVTFTSTEDDRINMLLRALNEQTLSSRNYFDNIKTPEIETKEQLVLQSFIGALEQLSTQFKTHDISKWQLSRPKTSITHPLFNKIGEFPTQTSGTYSFMVKFVEKNANSNGITVPVGMSRWPYGINAYIGLNQSGTPDITNPNLWKMLNLYRNYEYRQMSNFK
ncbi:penicillin acylase family protein [Neobacillus sp. 114]|uniref:penicillin acylase family protein n=1 Tax=Neobacillus sp. 114 TaxID=3048535 RepID=UPI0024C3727F|nr:penicillin acylase family protein [Neobacillus sp. 114]